MIAIVINKILLFLITRTGRKACKLIKQILTNYLIIKRSFLLILFRAKRGRKKDNHDIL